MVSRFCTNCGHQLGIGRYCINCGARVVAAPEAESDQETIVRSGGLPPVPTVAATAPPPPPPDPGPTPSSARYPLFADTTQSPDPSPSPAQTPTASYHVGARRRSRTPWLLALLVLAALAAAGVTLLVLTPSGDDDADDRTERARSEQVDREAPADSGSPLTPVDIQVPSTASPSVDGDGNRVTYKAANVLDADPTTSWRMAGDGTGAVLVLSFAEEVTVTEVGLVNGYAKVDPPNDWYAGNRRIAEVVWVFDDGTEVEQKLEADRALQTTAVDAVPTTTVALRLVQVTAPGDGPDARDYTAISEIVISGG